MEESTDLKGISIAESIKLFLKINVLIILFSFLFDLILLLPLKILGTYFTEIKVDSIEPYINALGTVLVYIFIIRKIIKKINSEENFQLKIQYKPKLKEYIYVILAAIAYLFIYSNTLSLLLSAIPTSKWSEFIFNEFGKRPLLLIIISTSIVAPIFEEVIYRGIILEQLNRRYGMIKAIVVSSLLFGIMHLNIEQGINGFFIGMVLGFIYIKTNSLLLSIFLHLANNSLVIISAFIPFIDLSSEKFNLVQLLCGAILLLIAYKFFNNIEIDTNRKFNLKIMPKGWGSKALDTDGN